jgi:methionyl-tRNA formyltransferase
MLRLAFMGTPDFAATILQALIDAGHEIAAVYAQPPRPAGRGHKPRPSPVQALAESHGLAVRTPLSLKSVEAQDAFSALKVDAAVVAAYGLILPPAILAAPRLGCLNVHASLLPRWRGAAPIQRAILAGDGTTGVTIMQMEAGLDTGPMVLSESLKIGTMNAGELHDALAAVGARLIVAALEIAQVGKLAATPQPEEGVTYAAKIQREEAKIDWTKDAAEIARQVRAFAPQPGAWFVQGEERIKLLATTPVEKSGAPGTVLDPLPSVACGRGALVLTRLQRAGKGALDAAEFLRGHALPVGTRLS